MLLLSFLLIVVIAAVDVVGACYTPGPAFPPVDRSLRKIHLRKLAKRLDRLLDDILESPKGWNESTTSFALQVTSRHDAFWGYYHTAPILGEYTDSDPTPVTGDTAFRVASISKSFTMYAILLEARINLEDPITKYVPELMHGTDEREEQLRVQWDQITIRSLASQLSGISRETAQSDLAVDTDQLPDPVSQGFPPVVPALLGPCLKNATDRACKPSDIVGVARNRTKVFNPNDRSTYSNVAFSLLGLALEKVTGTDYSEVITSSILEPLGMTRTTTTKPKDSDGVIPLDPNDWRHELGADNPTGGIYSTANDFSKYLQSILSSQLLPEAVTNAWMKPHSWTISGTNSAYGMPWEILRTTKLTPDGRGIDIVTKSGGLEKYYSTIAMMPEYGLGVTILVAGDFAALRDLSERTFADLVPAVEELIRMEVKANYTGVWAEFEDFWDGPPNMDFSLRFEVDDVGPGIQILDWVSNGTDFLSVYGRLKGMPDDHTKWEARLLPTGVYVEAIEENENLIDEVWRLTAIPKRTEENKSKVLDDYCMTDVDSLMYNGVSLEEFHIIRGFGDAGMLYISGLRTLMFKAGPGDFGVRGTVHRHGSEATQRRFRNWGITEQVPLAFR